MKFHEMKQAKNCVVVNYMAYAVQITRREKVFQQYVHFYLELYRLKMK